MKRLIALIFASALVLGLASCSQSVQHGTADESVSTETVNEELTSFRGTVLEIHGSHLLVEPFADSRERKSADKIEVPLAEKTSWPVPAAGDTVNVFYSGGILETYPARVVKVHRVEIEATVPDSNPDTAPDSEIPGATVFLVEIWDRAKEEQLPCDEAVEKFYEDESFEYYFSCIKSQYVIAMDNTGRTVDIVTALKEGLATVADLDRFGIHYWAEPKREDMDAVISRVILDHYRSDKPDGLIHTESHVILASETVSGTPQAGEYNHVEKTVVYLMALHVKYSTYGGTLNAVGSSYVPVAITFTLDDNGKYVLEEYWEPRDGYYAKDLRSKFPPASADAVLNDHQTYIEALQKKAYNKAVAYLDGIGSPNGRIAELLDEIQSSPAYASDPGAYIREHAAEYNELLGYGKYTLQYCFTEFLSGGKTDLRGHIMASACRDIMFVRGEGYAIDTTPLTGQAWFEEFRENAERLSKQFGHAELEQNFPGALLLLQLSDAEFALKVSP